MKVKYLSSGWGDETFQQELQREIDWAKDDGLTYYDNVDVISAGGLEEIQGNHKQVVKAQVRFKF